MNPHDEERLRALLDDAVSDVEPRPALDAIRSRTRVRPMSTRPWFLAAGAAVVATAATIAAFAVIGNDAGTTSSTPGPATSPSRAAVPSEPTSTSTTSAEAEPVPADAAVPVYYLGQTGQGPRLYREFHPGTGADPLTTAVNDAVSRTPDDPDYATPWPPLTAATATFDGIGNDGQITVNLGGDPQDSLHDRPPGMSRQTAQLAVQQLVYTAQAATQTTAPVQFTLFGERTDQLLGVPVSEPLGRADESSTLAQVWIISPSEGDTVTSGFTVKGVGAFFEANVVWELRQGDKVVASSAKSGPVMAQECCTMAPYTFTVDAPPGDYTLVVTDEDASGGEGPAPFQDTKNITVR